MTPFKRDSSAKFSPPRKHKSPPSAASATSSVENPRPILKLNTGSKSFNAGGDVGAPTPSAERKIKIKLNSQPGTPAPSVISQAPSVMSKAGRISKPTAKITESKKRAYDSDDDDEDKPLAATRPEARPNKTIKLTNKLKTSSATPHPVSNTPVSAIRFKPKGEPIPRKHGDAYDSEASDREEDPHRETNFILRVMAGDPAQYLKKALAEGTVGQPKANGGADFSVQFVDSKERRAMVTVNGINYAAVLVQLPTITEAMKTWDRKSMMKNSDITEMLLCFAEVKSEAEAKTIPLPPMVTANDLKWPHGITPPMHDAPNRRFRKVLSEKQWERTQNMVNKLLQDDAAADDVKVDIIMEDDDGDAEYEDDEDAEGELDMDDFFGDKTQPSVEMDMDIDMDAEEDDDLLREFLAGDVEFLAEAATPATQVEAPTPATLPATTPMPPEPEPASDEEEEDEEDVSDEDDDDDDDDDNDGEDRERKQQLSELHELQKQLLESEAKLQAATMPYLIKRLSSSIESIKKEISVKNAALGLTEED